MAIIYLEEKKKELQIAKVVFFFLAYLNYFFRDH